jgi:hypothetical protein
MIVNNLKSLPMVNINLFPFYFKMFKVSPSDYTGIVICQMRSHLRYDDQMIIGLCSNNYTKFEMTHLFGSFTDTKQQALNQFCQINDNHWHAWR